ncbi:mutS protein homolog 5 [Polypterus senegalus]|uniref:mutS protein homolog 5 n=1 Tax=Polypterus senegalus TaxID=55291 RepID=UPI001962C168|nr:mutS protein homolog 5 [Polypterus senegalus]
MNEQEDQDSNEESEVYLSVLCNHGQLGVAYYSMVDCAVHFMPDSQDNNSLRLLNKVIEDVHPKCLITSAKQEHNFAELLKKLNTIETVLYPNADFVLELSKQRILSAHLPFLPADLTDVEKISYLSSTLLFENTQTMRALGGLLKFLNKRRMGLELEDSSTGIPILAIKRFMLNHLVYMDRDAYNTLQIFKSELHPSVYKLASGVKEGLSLYGILNRCKSKFGSILMRQWFLQPTRDLEELKKRQEVVEFFTIPRHYEVMTMLQNCLKNIKSIPTVMRKMTLSQISIRDWQCLYKTIYNALCIRDTIRSLPQSIVLFRELSKAFTDDLHYIATLISKVIDFDGSVEENSFTIKPNVDPVIDEKKRKMMGLSDFLTDVAKKELDDLDSQIPSCSVIYIPLIGFLLSIPRLPNMLDRSDFEINGLEFMFLSENRLHYRSSRTKELDNLLGDLHCDINDMETAVITQLQGKILEKALVLNDVMEYSAQLDCLISLSEAAREFSYVKPTVSVQGVFRILQSRHPLLELCTAVFVSNPVHSSEKEGKIKVITGPNSCGKSIYLKQVGLIIFMAHIGSNVPASEAEIGLVDGIYTCMQTKESVSVGLSSFMIELNQMASALNNSTDKSVILIDEFGTGTNTVDGLSLFVATLRHWMKLGWACPNIFVSTHFQRLGKLNFLPASALHRFLTMETTVDGDELVFFYQLKEGLSESSYAANIATIAGMPANIVERAVEALEHYRTGEIIKRINCPQNEQQLSRCLAIAEKFLSLDLDDSSIDLQKFLKQEVVL